MSTPKKDSGRLIDVWREIDGIYIEKGRTSGDITADGRIEVFWGENKKASSVELSIVLSDDENFNNTKKSILSSRTSSEYSPSQSQSQSQLESQPTHRETLFASASHIKEVKANDIYPLLEESFLKIIRKEMNKSTRIDDLGNMKNLRLEGEREKKTRLKDGNVIFREAYWEAVRNSRVEICEKLYGILNSDSLEHAQLREFRLWGHDAYSNNPTESKLYIALTRYIDTTNAQRPVNSQVTPDMLGSDDIDINTNRMSEQLLKFIHNEYFSRIERVVKASSVFNPEQLTKVWAELSIFQLTQGGREMSIIELGGTVKLIITRANNDHRHDNDNIRTKLSPAEQNGVNEMMTVCGDSLINQLKTSNASGKVSDDTHLKESTELSDETPDKCAEVYLNEYTQSLRKLANATSGHTEKASMLQTVQYLQANGVKIASVDEDTMIADTTTACAARGLVKNSMGVRTEDISRDGKTSIDPIYSLHASHDAGISITGAKTGLICLACVQYDMCDGSVQIIQEVVFTNDEGTEQDSQTAETTGIDIRTTMNILDVHGNTIGTGSNQLEYLKKSAEGDVIFAGGALTLFNAAHFVWMPNLRAYSDGSDKIDRDNVHNYFNIFIRNIMAKWWGDYGIHFLMLLGADVAAQSQNDVIYCSDLSNSEATSGSIVTLSKSNENVRTFDRIIHGTNDQLAFTDSVLLAHFGLYKGKLPAAMLTCKDKGVVMLMTCGDDDGVKIRILNEYTHDDCGGGEDEDGDGEDEDGDGEDGLPDDAVKHLMSSEEVDLTVLTGKRQGSPREDGETTVSAEYGIDKKQHLKEKSSMRSELDSNVNPNAGGGTRRKRIPHKSKRTRKARRVRKTKRKSKRTRRARKSSRKKKTRRRVKK